MKKSLLTLAVVSAAMIGAPAAHATDTDDFVQKVANSTMFEIQSSQLALTRSQSADVKVFAQRMIDDHTKAEAEFKAAVAAGGIDAAKVPVALDKKHAKKLEKLNKEDAEDFDEEYIDDQEEAHEKAVKLFKDYADDGDNASLKAFAAKTLPTLEAHHAESETLDDAH